MENIMPKRDLVAMFMESPFYFDLHLQERLQLIKRHVRRFCSPDQTSHCHPGRAEGTEAGQVATIIVGYIPRRRRST